MTETSPAVALSGVNKWFGAHHVLRDVDLTVAKAEKIVICGPSGSGKSTLIRCVNGLEAHQQGTIRVDGTELTGTQAAWTPCAARSAWCSSTSTCSPISPCWRTAPWPPST